MARESGGSGRKVIRETGENQMTGPEVCQRQHLRSASVSAGGEESACAPLPAQRGDRDCRDGPALKPLQSAVAARGR